MKRSRILLFAGLAALALLAMSCDTLFTNQFKVLGLGQVASDSLSQAAADGDSATIIAESGLSSGEISQSFIDAVVSSADTTTKVLTALQVTASDPQAAPETVEAAQVLIVQIALEASGAKTMIDNVVNAIATINFSTFDINNPSSLTELLAALFPARSGKTLPNGWTVSDVADIIDTLAGGGTLGADLIGAIDGLATDLGGNGYVNANINGGWLAQVGTIVTVLRQLTPTGNHGNTIGLALANLINEYATGTDPTTYVTVPADLLTQIQTDANLQALFTAAGMNLNDILATFGAGS